MVQAIAELGVDCETVMLDLARGEQKAPAYLALNPHGVVPNLVADGAPLFEAVAILQWLGDRHGVERGLWPAAGTPARLAALSWTSWAYASDGPLVQLLNDAQGAQVAAALHHAPLAAEALTRLDAALGRLDTQLGGSPWLLGEVFSLADLAVASVVTYSAHCGVDTGGGIPSCSAGCWPSRRAPASAAPGWARRRRPEGGARWPRAPRPGALRPRPWPGIPR